MIPEESAFPSTVLHLPTLKPNNNACKDPHEASIDHKDNVLQLLERILYNSGSN